MARFTSMTFFEPYKSKFTLASMLLWRHVRLLSKTRSRRLDRRFGGRVSQPDRHRAH